MRVDTAARPSADHESRLRRAVGATAALLVMAAPAAVIVATSGAPADGHASIRPCAAEDSPGPCRWDAARQGNGRGQSFTRHADGTVSYDVTATEAANLAQGGHAPAAYWRTCQATQRAHGVRIVCPDGQTWTADTGNAVR